MAHALRNTLKTTRIESRRLDIPFIKLIRDQSSPLCLSPTLNREHSARTPQKQAEYLFRQVKRSLFDQGPEAAIQFSKKLLEHPFRVSSSIRTPFILRCIDGFLDSGHWDAAYKLYCLMKAEQLPGRADALAKLLRKSAGMYSNSNMLSEVIRDASSTLQKVDEPDLCAILTHLIRTKTDIYVIRDVIARFQEKKGRKWKPTWMVYALLARAEAQNGYNHAAEEFFKQSRVEIGHMKQSNQLNEKEFHDLKQKLYTMLFQGYTTFKRTNHPLYNELLLRMKKDNTTPSQRICNLVIELYKDKGQGNRAFAFYRAMRHSDILANSTTFSHLFELLRLRHSSQWELGYDGRRLFRYMAQQHAANTNSRPKVPSNVLDTDVLNAALRLFMVMQDYAAATVTVRTFPSCSILPNAQTRACIMDTLRRRIVKELLANTGTKAQLWSERMLGEVIQLWDTRWRHNLEKMLVSTVGQLSGSVRQAGIDISLLLALLRRAILSSENIWPGRNPAEDGAVVDREIGRAILRMLPAKPNRSEWYTDPISI